MDFSKIKKSLWQITKEMIPVILGILIALWINNWQKNKEDRAFLNHVFLTIEKEHEENIMELQSIIPLHERLTDSIYYHFDNENIVIGQFPEMTNGMSIALIGNTSWRAFISNDIKLIDFDLVANLSMIDEFKVGYQDQAKRLTDFFFENINNSKRKDKEILLFIIEDLISVEEKLLKEHLEAKTHLEKK